VKLKSVTVSCSQWTTQRELCMTQKSCGWCGSSNSCIVGNNIGPLSPCVKGDYFYTSPDSDWNPLESSDTSISRQAVGPAQLTTITMNNNKK
jgi:hypothetical protein